jgi:predicted cobalt transporter CbtA
VNSTSLINAGSSASAFELLTRLHRKCAGNLSNGTYLSTMRVKLASLISAISAIAVLSVSSTYAAVTVASGSGLSAAKPLANKADTIVAQAWWDAAANAANAQQQVTTGQGPPPVRRGTQRYRR